MMKLNISIFIFKNQIKFQLLMHLGLYIINFIRNSNKM